MNYEIQTQHDTWTKQLCSKIDINNAKHISKLKSKMDQRNMATALIGAKRSRCMMSPSTLLGRKNLTLSSKVPDGSRSTPIDLRPITAGPLE